MAKLAPVLVLVTAWLAGCAPSTQERPLAPVVVETGSAEAPAPDAPEKVVVARKARIGPAATARWRPDGADDEALTELVQHSDGVLLTRRDGWAALHVTVPRADLVVWVDEDGLARVAVRDAPLRLAPRADAEPHGLLLAGTVVETLEERGGFLRVAQTVFQLSSAITFDGWIAADDVGIAYAPGERHEAAEHHLELAYGESVKLLQRPGGEEIATIEQGIMQWTVELLASVPPHARVRIVAREEDRGVALEGWMPERLVALKGEAPDEGEAEIAVAEIAVAEAKRPAEAPGDEVPPGSCLHDRPRGAPVGKLRKAVAGDEGEDGWVAVDVHGLLLWVPPQRTSDCGLVP